MLLSKPTARFNVVSKNAVPSEIGLVIENSLNAKFKAMTAVHYRSPISINATGRLPESLKQLERLQTLPHSECCSRPPPGA